MVCNRATAAREKGDRRRHSGGRSEHAKRPHPVERPNRGHSLGRLLRLREGQRFQLLTPESTEARSTGTNGSNKVGSETRVCSAVRAFSTIIVPKARSSSGVRRGFPQTYSMRCPRMTLGAPVVSARLKRADIKATGMPTRSISFAIVAPQRLQVPQVATITTASTSPATSSSAISRPIRRESETVVPRPEVDRYFG